LPQLPSPPKKKAAAAEKRGECIYVFVSWRGCRESILAPAEAKWVMWLPPPITS